MNINPCRYCGYSYVCVGSAFVLRKLKRRRFVWCPICQACGPEADSETEAVALHNELSPDKSMVQRDLSGSRVSIIGSVDITGLICHGDMTPLFLEPPIHVPPPFPQFPPIPTVKNL